MPALADAAGLTDAVGVEVGAVEVAALFVVEAAVAELDVAVPVPVPVVVAAVLIAAVLLGVGLASPVAPARVAPAGRRTARATATTAAMRARSGLRCEACRPGSEPRSSVLRSCRRLAGGTGLSRMRSTSVRCQVSGARRVPGRATQDPLGGHT